MGICAIGEAHQTEHFDESLSSALFNGFHDFIGRENRHQVFSHLQPRRLETGTIGFNSLRSVLICSRSNNMLYAVRHKWQTTRGISSNRRPQNIRQ